MGLLIFLIVSFSVNLEEEKLTLRCHYQQTPAMLTFCPNCSNMLLISAGDDGLNRFYCSTCPYEFKINGLQMYDRKKLNRKKLMMCLVEKVPGIMSIKLQLSVR